jgi:glucokinase
LSPPNLPGWHRVPLAKILHDALGLDVVVDNDANAACLGEHRFGAGRGVADLVYFTISTGIGGGAIVNGALVAGTNGNAAELGHVSVAWDGWPCVCGGRGCVEAYCSGTSVARRARAQPSPRLRELAGLTPDAADAAELERITAEHVVAAVREGDPAMVAFWDDTMRVLAAGVGNAIQSFNPKRVILGGGLAHGAGALLLDPVRTYAKARVMEALANVVDVVPAALGRDAGVLGAAALALSRDSACVSGGA